MGAKRKTMKPHPYSQDLEKAMELLYYKEIQRQSKALHWILHNLAEEGYTQDEIIAAYNAFMASEPRTHSLNYFQYYLRKMIPKGVHTPNEPAMSEVW